MHESTLATTKSSATWEAEQGAVSNYDKLQGNEMHFNLYICKQNLQAPKVVPNSDKYIKKRQHSQLLVGFRIIIQDRCKADVCNHRHVHSLLALHHTLYCMSIGYPTVAALCPSSATGSGFDAGNQLLLAFKESMLGPKSCCRASP